jgi:purine nucleoside permease
MKKQALYLASQYIPIAHCDKHFTSIEENEIEQMNISTLRAWIHNCKTLSNAYKKQKESTQNSNELLKTYTKNYNSKPARARLKNKN